ncbi:MAG: AI-2E family transporter [Candidatus Yonathbacteria bacterium]|nr:AI-2E family transporter [Candidatus Yonathbacteria bacterium]
MSYQKTELYFLLTLITVMSVLVFFIFQPFIYTLFLAVIFATVFAPAHKRILILVRGNRGLGALLATAAVLLVIVIPVTFLSTQIFKEATGLYSSVVNNGGAAGISRYVEDFLRSTAIPFLPYDSLDVTQYMKQGLGLLIGNLDVVFSNVARIVISLFVLFLALYALFKEGGKVKRSIIALSPLSDAYDEAIFKKLGLTVNSVVRGSISVGLVQGALTALGLALFGVPNPVLWGTIAAVAALIPGVGTSLVLLPAILFLVLTGAPAPAVGLLIWGLFAVGLVDNILGPKIVGYGAKLHPFLILLSILGGVSFFGPLGFLFGPLALSLLFAFLEIYSTVRGARNS